MDMTREHQRRGNFTELEKSQKAHNDQAAAYYEKQLGLIEAQKEYGLTMKRATAVSAFATVIIALAMIVQCFIMLSGSAPSTIKPAPQGTQQSHPN